MRIGIDASWASAIGTGTASYTEGLVKALVKHTEHEFFLYFRPGDDQQNPLYHLSGGHIHRRVVRGPGQPGRTLLALSARATRDRFFPSSGKDQPPPGHASGELHAMVIRTVLARTVDRYLKTPRIGGERRRRGEMPCRVGRNYELLSKLLIEKIKRERQAG